MLNLFFRGRRELSTGLQLQKKDYNHTAGNLFPITGHIYCEMLLADCKNNNFILNFFLRLPEENMERKLDE